MKYEQLRSTIDKPFFNKNEIILKNHKIFNYQLTNWVAKGYLDRIRNNIYLFKEKINSIEPKELATIIYEPSYISLETGLTYYGFIPEVVYAVTSLTTKINRTFHNTISTYIYRNIRPSLFWGYLRIETTNGGYLIAEPEKCLLDFLYLNLNKLNSETDFNNLRLNNELIFETIDKDKFNDYINAFNNKKLKELILICLLNHK